MGKGLLIIVAAAILAASVYGMSVQQSHLSTVDRKAAHDRKVLARNAALAGYALAKQRLAESFTSGSLSGEFSHGSYAASISVVGEEAKIVSRGSYGDAEVKVSADFTRELAHIFDVVPQFMRYALLSDGPLSLRGDILGEIYVRGTDFSRLNANMHTNDGLSVLGNSVRVHGFGTYVSSASFSSEKAASNSFQPNSNPSGSEAVTRTSAINIPPYDAASFVAKKAPESTTSGDLTLSGHYDLGGTREAPFVWHVTGNLTFSSDTNFSGYVLFLVDQNVNVYGDVTVDTPEYNGADESSLALYSGGRIELGGSSTVYAQLFSGGDVVFLNGTPSIYGSITTKGTADLRGTPQIYYRNASPALTYLWQDPQKVVRLIGYSEV